MRNILIAFFCLISLLANSATYYVAPTGGSDSYAGTLAQPWATPQKAFNTATAGDTVYFRGGTWYPTTYAQTGNVYVIDPHAVSPIGHDGTAENPICYFNYPNEVPIIDGYNMILGEDGWNTGIALTRCNYMHFKGLTIRNLYQNPALPNPAQGISASLCSNMTFENMTIHNIGGRGYYFSTGFGYPYALGGNWDTPDDTTRWINCDTYNIADTLAVIPGNEYNSGDGWKIHCVNYDNQYEGTWDDDDPPGACFYLYGCRAWNCSDDGFDPSGSGLVIINKCWSFYNGHFGEVPDGNGFKFGDSRDTVPDPLRIVHHCLAAFNSGYGIYDLQAWVYLNNSRIYNNTSYGNGAGFVSSANDGRHYNLSHWYNNITYENTDPNEIGGYMDVNIRAVYGYYEGFTYNESHNTWDFKNVGEDEVTFFRYTDTVTVTDADFVLVDSTAGMVELLSTRETDGSLPTITFLTLAATSDLINMGTVNVPDISGVLGTELIYDGAYPDIGYYEYSLTEGVVPTVSTTVPTNITSKRAISGGNVTSDGGDIVIERGVCWSISTNPTTVDSKATAAGTTGSFTANITGLSSNTTYHVRAYAINGIGTGYGADESFTTKEWGIGKSGSVYVVNNDGKIIVIK